MLSLYDLTSLDLMKLLFQLQSPWEINFSDLVDEH